jgi:hypothetical protein
MHTHSTHIVAYMCADLESLVARDVARGLAELAARHHRRKPEHTNIQGLKLLMRYVTAVCASV